MALQRLNVQIRDTLTQTFQELCAPPVEDGREENPEELWGMLKELPEEHSAG